MFRSKTAETGGVHINDINDPRVSPADDIRTVNFYHNQGLII